MVALHYAVGFEQEKLHGLQTQIEHELQQNERIQMLKQRIANKKSSIKKLQGIYVRSKNAIQQKKAQQMTKAQFTINHLEQLIVSSRALHQQVSTLNVYESAKIPKLKSQLDILMDRYERRQKQIGNMVAKCFEVAPDKTGRWRTINGLAIFKNDQLSTNDEAASALGLVCQCIRIFSKLYQIPLKYQVFPLASRSFVKDDDTSDQKLLLPLFIMRASEKPKFYRAVLLLNLNIRHVLKVRGIQTSVKNKFDVLESLELLMEHVRM